MGRATRLTGLLLAAGLVVAGCSGNDPQPPEASESPTAAAGPSDLPASVYGDYRADVIAAGGMTADLALRRFVMSFGSIGDIEAPADDGSIPPTGTDALHHVEDFWDEYPAAVQDEILERIAAYTSDDPRLLIWDGRAQGGGEGVAAGTVQAAAIGGVTSVGAESPCAPAPPWARPRGTTGGGGDGGGGDGGGGDGPPTVIEEPTAGETAYWRDLLEEVIDNLVREVSPDFRDLLGTDEVAGPLGSDTSAVITLAFGSNPARPGLGASTDPGTFAFPNPFGPDDCVVNCSLTIVGARRQSRPQQLNVLTHELVHCYSIRILGLAGHQTTPLWVQEGLAALAGEAVGASTSNYGGYWWSQYLSGEGAGALDLFRHDYEAFGFFADIHDQTGRVLRAIPGLLRTSVGNNSSGVYTNALALLGRDGPASITAGTTRHPTWGDGWDLGGIGITSHARRPNEFTINHGDLVVRSIPAGGQLYEQARIGVVPVADDGWWAVELTVAGSGRYRWEAGTEFIANGAGQVTWCVGGDCTCEDGSVPFDSQPLGNEHGDLHLATTGAADVSSDVALRIITDEEACEECPTGSAASVLPVRWSNAQPADSCPAADSCLVGTWMAAPDQAERHIMFRYGRVGGEFHGGDMFLTLGVDGLFEQRIEDADIRGTQDGMPLRSFYDATGTGTWTTPAIGTMEVHLTEVVTTTQVFVDGFSPGPNTDTRAIDDRSTTPYMCTDVNLIIDTAGVNAEGQAFPTDWQRVS